MSIEINHLIVAATDKTASARFLAEVLGVELGPEVSHFQPVQIGESPPTTTTPQTSGPCTQFLVDDATFDAAHGRLNDAGAATYADPGRNQPGQINHRYGGRGIYFDDPDGHLFELMTARTAPSRRHKRITSSSCVPRSVGAPASPRRSRPRGANPKGASASKTATSGKLPRLVSSESDASMPIIALNPVPEVRAATVSKRRKGASAGSGKARSLKGSPCGAGHCVRADLHTSGKTSCDRPGTIVRSTPGWCCPAPPGLAGRPGSARPNTGTWHATSATVKPQGRAARRTSSTKPCCGRRPRRKSREERTGAPDRGAHGEPNPPVEGLDQVETSGPKNPGAPPRTPDRVPRRRRPKPEGLRRTSRSPRNGRSRHRRGRRARSGPSRATTAAASARKCRSPDGRSQQSNTQRLGHLGKRRGNLVPGVPWESTGRAISIRNGRPHRARAEDNGRAGTP